MKSKTATRGVNFKNFTEKHVLESLFNEVAGLRLQHRCFLVKFAKFIKTPILKNICQRLFLSDPMASCNEMHRKSQIFISLWKLLKITNALEGDKTLLFHFRFLKSILRGNTDLL